MKPVDKGLMVSFLVALIVTPAVVIAVRSLFTAARPLETVLGAFVATVFFGLTSAAVVLSRGRLALGTPVLGAYALKIVLLVVTGILLSSSGLDRYAFAVGVLSAAVSYLAVQIVMLGRRLPPE